MALRLIAAPSAEPVTLAEAKEHLAITHSANDLMIGALITAARQNLDGPDGTLGRALMPQTWELVYDTFPDGPIRIPLPPLRSVESIKYLDTDGVEQTVPPSDYTVDAISVPGWIAPKASWPASFDTVNAVRIQFQAGYDDAPKPIAAAILLMVADLFANREGSIIGKSYAANPALDYLLFPYRMLAQ